jgi:hypothetical protein
MASTPEMRSGVEYVRSNRTVFLGPSGTPDLRDLAADLVTDALVLGVHPVTVDLIDDWYVVAAPQDWITLKSRHPLIECFRRVEIFHEHRRNSNRATILINAFAKNVLVLGAEGVTVVKGCDNVSDAFTTSLMQRFSNQRVVVFSGLDP